MKTKTCSKCKIEKPLEKFSRDNCNRWAKYGRHNMCKLCKSSYNSKEYQRNYKKQRRETDIEFRLKDNLKTRLNSCVKLRKKNKFINELGCDISTFRLHLENNFTPEMNWDNYGTYWEVDHIHPLSKSGSFHYTNTQPLTVKENREKSAKIVK